MALDLMGYSYKSKKALKYFNHVEPGLWKSYVKIVEIRKFRHFVDWGEGKSSISYCNCCGNGFSFDAPKELSKRYSGCTQCANEGCKLINCDIELYKEHIKIKHEILFRKFS